MNLRSFVDQCLIDLEDSDQVVWKADELDHYVGHGYEDFAHDSGAIFDMAYAENLPYAGTHNGIFEEPFLDINIGRFTFTGGEWERDYSDNGVGPANHTAVWEVDYTTTDFILATSILPDTLVAVDRVVHDSYRVLPAHLPRIRRFDGRYQYTQGPTRSYVFEEDGLFTIRKVPVPAARADTYVHDGNRGTLRSADANEFGISQQISGSRGVLRVFPGHFPGGDRRGGPRRLYAEAKNVRVEIIRTGPEPSLSEFEMPNRYMRYVEHYVRAKALEREGEGQDLKLAEHFMQRFKLGTQRLKMRRERVLRARVGHFGAGGPSISKPPLVKMPWPYPKIRW